MRVAHVKLYFCMFVPKAFERYEAFTNQSLVYINHLLIEKIFKHTWRTLEGGEPDGIVDDVDSKLSDLINADGLTGLCLDIPNAQSAEAVLFPDLFTTLISFEV